MDSLHLAIAVAPLATYMAVLGCIQLTRRPLVTTGARDLAALGLAIGGFIIVGPMELFMPQAAAAHFGWFVWLLLLSLYGVSLSLLVLLSSPRVVIYNITWSELEPSLLKILQEFDHEMKQVGESFSLPNVGMQFTVEEYPTLRHLQLTSTGSSQNMAGWRALELELAEALEALAVPPNPYGISLLLFAMTMFGVIGYFLVTDQEAVAQSLRHMLRL